ncbi:hypothetical protein DMUE_1347 [Dictyocoela muelleri]|nr:hypothetical protein DMUE_1347 [Dictyocoela muelleri]
MFRFFKKSPTLKDTLLSLEKKIKKTETSLSSLKQYQLYLNKNFYFILSIYILLITIYNIVIELRFIKLSLIMTAIALILRKIILKIVNRRVSTNEKFLESLKDLQKSKIEEFKKDTQYIETRKIVEKYEKESRKPKITENKKSLVDSLTDAIIGEDPSTMYALICEKCYYHNGLVHPKNYNQSKFKCYHCQHFNDKLKEC